MSIIRLALLTAFAGIALTPATAKTVTANYGNLSQVLNEVVGGDTIVLNGEFGLMTTKDLHFDSTLFIDASNAVFNRTWNIYNVENLSVTGGEFRFQPDAPVYLRAVEVYGGSHISFDGGLYTDTGSLGGISFSDTLDINISNNKFYNMKKSISISFIDGGKIYNNLTVNSTEDGINIRGSQNILASHNSCIGSDPFQGAHPDCIQVFGVLGRAITENIEISDNLAFGDTQGFTKFASGGIGRNITMIRNLVETTRPQGIACYDCYGSNISDNLLVTLADSVFDVRARVIGGEGNVVSGNVFENLGQVLPYRPAPGTIWHNAGVIPWLNAVPESSTWLSMILGFGLLGSAMRLRRQFAVRTAAIC